MVSVIMLTISLSVESNIFWLTYYVGTVFASSWGAVAFMSVWSDKITADAAFWGIISGFAANVSLRLLDTLGWVDLPSYFDPILVGGVFNLLVVLAVSRFGTVTETERSRRLDMHELPADEQDASQTRRTQWIVLSVAAMGVFVTFMLLVFYAWPYQVATATLRDGHQFDWLAGESILALSWSFLFVPLGLMAYKMVGRAYGGDASKSRPLANDVSKQSDVPVEV